MMKPSVGIPESSIDLSFGFNDRKFSDRILLLHIIHNEDKTPTTAPTTPQKEIVKKTIHVNSLILAARSPFFHKLFSNGMKESEQQHVTIKIKASEEVPFRNLLKYIYSNRVPTTQWALLDLLETADKFEVESCMRECSGSLLKLPMTTESATIYLDLPQTLLMAPETQPLIAAAKKFFVGHFNDLDKYKDEMLKLPLAGIEAILSSDDLQVTSEFDVYDFFLSWAYNHYQDSEEIREIFKTYLLKLIRFPFIPTEKLIVEAKSCNDTDQELASQVYIHALCLHAGTRHQNRVTGEKGSHAYVERAYKNRPVKVVELNLPHKEWIVYLHFSKEGLKRIFPDGYIKSEAFHLGREELILSARCSIDQGSNKYYFWLAIKMVGLTSSTVEYKIAVRTKSSKEFGTLAKGSLSFPERGITRYVSPMEWTSFIGDDSKYFIHGTLYVRAQFIMKK